MDKHFAFAPVKKGEVDYFIFEANSIPNNMTVLSKHFKISYQGNKNPRRRKTRTSFGSQLFILFPLLPQKMSLWRSWNLSIKNGSNKEGVIYRLRRCNHSIAR